jgi:Outer membrane protein beta-barrel domain
MTRKTTVWTRGASVVAAALFAGSVLADEGPRYTYAEAGYSVLDIDDFDEDGDIFSVGGSLAVHEKVHLFAAYSDGSIDGSGFDIDITNVEVGGGLNLPLSNTVDLVLDAAYVWAELDADNFDSVDDDGFALRAGLRAMLTPKFELNGGGTYVDVSDDDTALYVGAVYNFTDMFAMTGGASIGDNATSYGVGLRLYFDTAL